MAFSEWLIMPAAAGVKLERPSGRATLAPVTTGAGAWDEKAREGRRGWSHERPVGLLPGRTRMTFEVRPGCSVMEGVHMPELQVNSVQLYYEEHGQGHRSSVSTAPEAPPSCGPLRSPSWPG
jgi:hypothetical protein